MTLSWPRLTWPAWDARQAGPRWRKMSATSTAGRDNGRASAGHLPQKVERAGHLADRADGDAGIDPSCRVSYVPIKPGLSEYRSSAPRDAGRKTEYALRSGQARGAASECN